MKRLSRGVYSRIITRKLCPKCRTHPIRVIKNAGVICDYCQLLIMPMALTIERFPGATEPIPIWAPVPKIIYLPEKHFPPIKPKLYLTCMPALLSLSLLPPPTQEPCKVVGFVNHEVAYDVREECLPFFRESIPKKKKKKKKMKKKNITIVDGVAYHNLKTVKIQKYVIPPLPKRENRRGRRILVKKHSSG